MEREKFIFDKFIKIDLENEIDVGIAERFFDKWIFLKL